MLVTFSRTLQLQNQKLFLHQHKLILLIHVTQKYNFYHR